MAIENNQDLDVIDMDDLQTYDEAIIGVHSDRWWDAMKSDINYMYSNKVWILVYAIEGITFIGCKWIFKRMIREYEILKYANPDLLQKNSNKSMVLIMIILSIAILKSIRILLVITTCYNYEIWLTNEH